MKFNIKTLSLLVIISFSSCLAAQTDSIQFNIKMASLNSTGDFSPFWLQSNQFGTISEQANSAMFFAGISKSIYPNIKHFNYGFKANALLKTSTNNTKIYFDELFANAKYWVFDMYIGKKHEITGNQDTTLSSGGLLFSGNSQAIPQIYAGIQQFTAIPYTKGLFEIKGGLSHGWFTDNIAAKNILLHHKSCYIRVGGKLPIKFQYGFEHVAQWGGTIPGYGKLSTGLSDYINVFFGHAGGSNATENERINVLGNHIISQGTKLEISLNDYSINAYWQNISEDTPIRFIWNTMNISDGLWGISLKNKNFPFVKGILYEYLNTTDQSGPYHDKDGIVFGGNDSYFNNYLYSSGWTNYSRTIGTAFISSPSYNQSGNNCIENNRVQMHHFGAEGNISSIEYKVFASFSKNYGTYSNPYSNVKTAKSFLITTSKYFPKFYGIKATISVASDFSNMYGNSTGCMIGIQKSGNLLKY